MFLILLTSGLIICFAYAINNYFQVSEMPDYNRRSSSWPEMGSLLSRYFQSASTGQSRQHLERTLKAPSHASKEERSSHADALSEEIAKLSVGTRFNHRTKPAAVVETHGNALI